MYSCLLLIQILRTCDHKGGGLIGKCDIVVKFVNVNK